jgi:two-component sensor histidine kinase
MKSFFAILFLLGLDGGAIKDHPAAETAIGIGELHVRQGKFHEVRSYLQRVVNDKLLAGQVSDRRTMELLLFERNFVLACSSILFVVSAFVLWGYRMKKRHDSQLHRQLIGEKDKLLAEKDLLMREIHHRVKNNLNIIISLLESQSLYLYNDVARAALQDTQNRVHAVFLLHEKLYGSTTVPELNVHTYVLELINHLYESFDFRNQNIVITHTIEPIYLDASEVLPLAVILNEAVTNSLKYAFPDGRKGEIHLTLRQTPAGMVQMRIRDNGVGLPAGYSPAFGKTLGFTLITGLANQLQGCCKIENEAGVVIAIQFRPKERRAFPLLNLKKQLK